MSPLPTAAAQAATVTLPTHVAQQLHHALPLPAPGEGGPGQGLLVPPVASLPAVSVSSSSSTTPVNREVNLKDSLRYFIAGNIAGMTGVIVGQPFDTLKVRMQTQGQVQSFSAASSASSASGAARFARNNFAAPSLYQPPVFSMGASGASRAVSAAAAPPLGPLFNTPWQCFLSTIRSSGVRGLYRGMSSPLLLVGCQKSVAFGVFGTVVQHLQRQAPLPSLGQVCVAGVAGGVANSLILTPVDQLKIAMQIQGYGRPSTTVTPEMLLTGHPSAPQPSLLSTAKQLIREQGFLRGIYGNFRATLLREVPMYSIYYTLYSYLHRTFIVDHSNRSRWIRPSPSSIDFSSSPPARSYLSFISDANKEVLTKLSLGGLTGVGCWASCYPLDTIKSSMVTQTAQNIREDQRKTIRRMVQHIYHTGGIRAFYSGLTPALLRAFPVHAVVFFSFATVSEWLEANGM